MKEMDFVMKVMEIWMTLDELYGARTRRYFIDSSGTKDIKQFKYHQPFGFHFRYNNQVDDHNNRRHAPISLDITWETKFWPDYNFDWYLEVSEVNTSLVPGHFKIMG